MVATQTLRVLLSGDMNRPSSVGRRNSLGSRQKQTLWSVARIWSITAGGCIANHCPCRNVGSSKVFTGRDDDKAGTRR